MSLPSFGIKSYRAEDFFLGRKLEIARALEARDMALVRKLAKGTDLSAPADRDMTLLAFFMMPGTPTYPNYAAVHELIALGVDPDKQSIKGVGTALQTTMIPRKDPKDQTGVRFLQAMLEGGMSPEKIDQDGTPLILRAAGDGELVHVQLLNSYGVNLDSRSQHLRRSALHRAISSGQPETAIYLMKNGAPIGLNGSDNGGVTPEWALSLKLNRTQTDHTIYKKFEQLRDLMIAKGAKWPPDPPEVVRERMRAKGIKPIVPAGQQR